MTEWSVEVGNWLTEELAESFAQGPILDDNGTRLLTEKQVARVAGLKIEVFSHEHPPPHFRVKYSGETANYTIDDCTQMNGGLKKFYRNIKTWHAKNKDALISAWNKMRPGDCPVGKYEE